MRHDPPQVLTVVAITCRQCGGSEYFDDHGQSSLCHLCENGYEKVMVPLLDLMDLIKLFGNGDGRFHREVAALAEANHVRLPVLTHLTSNLPVHLLPTKRRIPLVVGAPKQFPPKT